jgi:salicylate hydroxylase
MTRGECICWGTRRTQVCLPGTGARMALEDAFVVSALLGEVEEKERTERALGAFEEVRKPTTQRLVVTSREGGKLYGFEGLWVGNDGEIGE